MSTPAITAPSSGQENSAGYAPVQERGASDFSNFLSEQGPSGGGNAAGASGAQPASAGGAGTEGRVPSKPASAAEATQSVAGNAGAGAAAAQGEGRPQAAEGATGGAGGQTPADPAMIQSIVEAAVRGARAGQPTQQAPQAQADKPLSNEEFAAKYRLPTVTEQHVAALLGADPKVAARTLQELLYQAVHSGLLMGQDRVSTELKRVREDYDPHISSWKQHQERQRDEEAFNGFLKTYPDLKDEVPLVLEMKDAVLARIQAGTFKPKDQNEAFQAIATSARALVARMNKNQPQGQATPAAGAAPTQPARQMAAALSVGQSGSGQPTKKSDEESIFGHDFV